MGWITPLTGQKTLGRSVGVGLGGLGQTIEKALSVRSAPVVVPPQKAAPGTFHGTWDGTAWTAVSGAAVSGIYLVPPTGIYTVTAGCTILGGTPGDVVQVGAGGAPYTAGSQEGGAGQIVVDSTGAGSTSTVWIGGLTTGAGLGAGGTGATINVQGWKR